MAWSYDPEVVADTDKVRLLIGDTDTSDQQLQDEEIAFLLSSNNNSVYGAAATACRTLAAKYARYSDKWVGDLKILASQKARAYLAMADQYEHQEATSGALLAAPTAGGMYAAEKAAYEQDTSLVHGFFKRGMTDNPE